MINIKKVLEEHEKWLHESSSKGTMANFRGAILNFADLKNANLECAVLKSAILSYSDLSNANLSYADLSYADLKGVNFKGANLSHANLRGANLNGAVLDDADLSWAVLSYTNLSSADLKRADLNYANLRGANLNDANLSNANLRGAKINFPICCPEKGSFIGFKKAGERIVELRIEEDALRSSATTRKCRCSKATVLSITDLDGNLVDEIVRNFRDDCFKFEVGKTVEDTNFDTNRWNESSLGIHFFLTRQEAVDY